MSTQQATRTQANIELIIFGFLVSLTLKGGLDAAYSKAISTATTWQELWSAIWVFPSLQLFVFLITLLRFVYGAYRVHEVADEYLGQSERWVLLWNIPGTLVLFILFYITGLSVHSPVPFYIGLSAVHLWDLIWFIIPALFADGLKIQLKCVMRSFLVIDILTILVLLLALTLSGKYSSFTGAGLMMIFAVLDFYWNRRFFFYPDEWRTQSASSYS